MYITLLSEGKKSRKLIKPAECNCSWYLI